MATQERCAPTGSYLYLRRLDGLVMNRSVVSRPETLKKLTGHPYLSITSVYQGVQKPTMEVVLTQLGRSVRVHISSDDHVEEAWGFCWNMGGFTRNTRVSVREVMSQVEQILRPFIYNPT